VNLPVKIKNFKITRKARKNPEQQATLSHRTQDEVKQNKEPNIEN
jgi:hypothetical protein